LIRKFEITTLSFKDSQIDLSEQNEVVSIDKGYFGAKPKGFDATIKRAVKHPIGMSYFFKKQAN
jgi:23S rRNA maturation-related 3'-5' exoribonuclease YhaM